MNSAHVTEKTVTPSTSSELTVGYKVYLESAGFYPKDQEDQGDDLNCSIDDSCCSTVCDSDAAPQRAANLLWIAKLKFQNLA